MFTLVINCKHQEMKMLYTFSHLKFENLVLINIEKDNVKINEKAVISCHFSEKVISGIKILTRKEKYQEIPR